MNRGALYGAVAYTLWGLLPVYWKALGHVPAYEILGHRVTWSFLFLALLLLLRRRWAWVMAALSRPRTLAILAASAALLGLNWFIYIWAVNAGFVVEASLGYFITPLINVLLGVLVLRERLRPLQWLAVALAAAGVIFLTLVYGALPWIALVLAGTFGVYGLLKKKVRLAALESLSAEMAFLLLPALFLLAWLTGQAAAVAEQAGPRTIALLAGTGLITTVPLLLFAGAAHRIPLVTIGVLQYIAPTFQFLLGVFVYAEPLPAARLLGFGIVWLGLLVYTLENIHAGRSRGARLRRGRTLAG